MNQDQVKEFLLKVHDTDQYFSVVFTGKSSKKVDGLYFPENHEILIHNKNMESDNEILYTALHEYAHHLQFCTAGALVSRRSHTREFWNIFHELLDAAEKKGMFENIYRSNKEFIELTQRIKEQFIEKNGTLMLEFGQLLCSAVSLCEKYHVSFEDYVDREIGLHRHSAKTLIDVFKKDIDPSIGFENMTSVARIKDAGQRKEAEKAFIDGQSRDRVLHTFTNQTKPSDPMLRLESERLRLQKTISTLQKKLESIEDELAHLSS